jgi:protein tyrosine/serine phosphatase
MTRPKIRICRTRLARLQAIGLILAACLVMNGLPAEGNKPKTARPASWAQPISLEGVPNLYKVSDMLYRSGQPTAAGMKRLEQLGIKTVVNLRSFHSDKDKLRGTKLVGEAIPMKAWHADDAEAVRFLRIAENPARAPILVHCEHGADRTGMMIAIYRIVVQGWTKDAAIREMVDGGYGFQRRRR